METQNGNIRKACWKFGLLAIATPAIYFSIFASNQFIFSKTENTSAKASEAKYNISSLKEKINITGNSSEDYLEKTESVPTSSQPEQEKDRLDFSDTGRAGQQTAGESRGRCSSTQLPLTALVPVSNWGKTVRKHPTFWFYVPVDYNTVTEVEFVLQDQNRNNLWKQQLSVDEISNYLSVKLPQEQPELQIGKWYRWYFKVYCDKERRYAPKTVYGWVTRVPKDASLQSQLKQNQKQPYKAYGKAGIWFDAVDSLLKQNNFKVACLNFQQGWQQLMKAKGVNLNLPKPQTPDSLPITN